MDLSNMSAQELKDLSRRIGLELQKRINEIECTKREALANTQQYEFEFEAELKKEKPYVARCYYEKGIERVFKNIPTCGNACSGKYTACEGEILDIRGEDGRNYYAVYCGELIELCTCKDSLNICRIMQYLKGQMQFNVLLEILGVKEVDNAVIDDLKDE